MNVEALSRYMTEAADKPARLGHHDCVSFVFEGIREGWDLDLLDKLKYHGRRGAIDRLRDAGGLYDAICEHLGQDLPLCELIPGDVAWLPPANIGLIMDGYIAVKWRRTVLRVPLDKAASGWRTR
jgi:hypothetical protein